MDYFEVFGLPRILNIDPRELEKSFHELSRKYHPDYFTTAAPEEKQQALRMTALLNDAYRTLRNPLRRAEYLVRLQGFKPDGSSVPKSFLMEVFDINERLADLKAEYADPAQVRQLRADIEQRAEEFAETINAATQAWDALVARNAPDAEKKQQLARMTEILSEYAYIRNLERELEELN